MIINNMYFLLLFQIESNRGKEAPEYSCMLHAAQFSVLERQLSLIVSMRS